MSKAKCAGYDPKSDVINWTKCHANWQDCRQVLLLCGIEATVDSKAQVNGCCHFGHISPTNHSLTDRNEDRRSTEPGRRRPTRRRQMLSPAGECEYRRHWLRGRRYVDGQITSQMTRRRPLPCAVMPLPPSVITRTITHLNNYCATFTSTLHSIEFHARYSNAQTGKK